MNKSETEQFPDFTSVAEELNSVEPVTTTKNDKPRTKVTIVTSYLRN